MIPNIFYITEKAWNYYPYTETGKVFLYHLGVCHAFSFLVYVNFFTFLSSPAKLLNQIEQTG